ncbi:Anaphase promoting complex subunit 11 [Bulinus truncatus]|nr:Anaphase promoting complex subunit 11 [Bulinus truncatus]
MAIEAPQEYSWKLNHDLKIYWSSPENKRSNNWTGVATWKWIANDDNCGICRMAFDGCCPDCKLPGDECPLVWGQCSHVFHIHCIVKWLQSQTVSSPCPMCRQEWKWKAG